jgi:hypothetical protein
MTALLAVRRFPKKLLASKTGLSWEEARGQNPAETHLQTFSGVSIHVR